MKKQRFVINLTFWVCYFYYLLLITTIRVRMSGDAGVYESWNKGKNVAFFCPHQAILGCFVCVEKLKIRRPIALLASLSNDGELVARLLAKRQFELVRGSSRRGAIGALRALRAAITVGKSVGLAFDGPKGPPLVAKPGVGICALAVKGPVFLVHLKTPKSFIHGLRVRSWDKMFIPLPFCRLEIELERFPARDEMLHLTDKEYTDFITEKVEKRSRATCGALYGLERNEITF